MTTYFAFYFGRTFFSCFLQIVVHLAPQRWRVSPAQWLLLGGVLREPGVLTSTVVG